MLLQLIAAIPLLGESVPDIEPELTGKKVAFLLADEFNRGETRGPMEYLAERNAIITVVGIETGPVVSQDTVIETELSADQVSVEDFDAIVIPGGRSAGHLSKSEAVLELVRSYDAVGKPVAGLCSGRVVMIRAAIMDGKRIAGSPGFHQAKDATYEDVPAVRDGNLITGRGARDVRAFSEQVARALADRPAEN